jgi:hypothetical protein
MLSMPRFIALASGAAVAFLAIPCARAADIAATIPIDRVTVYRDSAIVTRAGPVEVPAGDHRLILRNLPGELDPASLRLSARSPHHGGSSRGCDSSDKQRSKWPTRRPCLAPAGYAAKN